LYHYSCLGVHSCEYFYWEEGALPFTELPAGNFMENLTLSSINCNSLNLSDVSKVNQNRKLLAISKLRTDVILLSDIRLSNKNKVSCSKSIEECFRTNPFGNYMFFHNSTQNKRGVGILISNKLGAKCVNRKDDPEENYLLLEIELKGCVFILGAVYGPNNYDPEFFTRLKNDLNFLGSRRIILSGDWNCTPSSDEVSVNLDVLNMRALPNEQHSILLGEQSSEFDLIEPFRFKFPDSQEFTFIPRSALSKNRSRIDFFLVNEFFTQSELDHRAVFLSLAKKRVSQKYTTQIDAKIFKDDVTEFIVQAAVLECYILHLREEALVRREKNLLLQGIGNAKKLIRDVGILPLFFQGEDVVVVQDCNSKLDRLREILMDIEGAGVTHMEVAPDPDVFFETLLFMIKNELIEYQAFAKKQKRFKENELVQDIKALRAAPDP
jgi:exonuclease III